VGKIQKLVRTVEAVMAKREEGYTMEHLRVYGGMKKTKLL